MVYYATTQPLAFCGYPASRCAGDGSSRHPEPHIAPRDNLPATIAGSDRIPIATPLSPGGYHDSGIHHDWENASQDMQKRVQRNSVDLHRNFVQI
jgi:hypothetical protein